MAFIVIYEKLGSQEEDMPESSILSDDGTVSQTTIESVYGCLLHTNPVTTMSTAQILWKLSRKFTQTSIIDALQVLTMQGRVRHVIEKAPPNKGYLVGWYSLPSRHGPSIYTCWGAGVRP